MNINILIDFNVINSNSIIQNIDMLKNFLLFMIYIY